MGHGLKKLLIEPMFLHGLENRGLTKSYKWYIAAQAHRSNKGEGRKKCFISQKKLKKNIIFEIESLKAYSERNENDLEDTCLMVVTHVDIKGLKHVTRK